MKKMIVSLMLIACVLTSAFSQVQIFEKKNKTNQASNLINAEFEIWPNSLEQTNYQLSGKSLTYFIYEEGKSASDFTGDLWYFDLGDGVNVASWEYADVYFYDVSPVVVTDTKKANIACVVEFKNGASIKPNLYASLELAIYSKWDYYGYRFDESDDWSNIDEPITPSFDATDYYSLNRYVTFWDNNLQAAYSGYYPQVGAYDNIIYVDYDLASGSNNGSSWANAYRGAGALQRALDKAKAVSSPTNYIQVWISGDNFISESSTMKNAGGPVDIIGGFNKTENHEFQREDRKRTHADGEIGDVSTIDDNLRNFIHIENGQTNMPIYIDGFYVEGFNALDVDSALFLSHTNSVVKNCTFYKNHHSHADGSAGPGGAAIWFSDKYNPYWGNSLHVENCHFYKNYGVVRGATITVRSCQKRAQFVNCRITRGVAQQFTDVAGIWSYAYQTSILGGGFLACIGENYKLIQASGAYNYKDYNSAYQTVTAEEQ